MEMNTMIFIVFLLFMLISLVRMASLQRQVNELKRDVERLENGAGVPSNVSAPLTSSLSQQQGSSSSFTASSSTIDAAPSELDQELLSLLQKDQKIKAIKRLREARGLSLKEAKDYVESLDR
ncbi:ribosomal protein L7/L12 [Paenibacillus sp. DCT19]|uniref:ribosomal protein L7/L12 n=1 Tax=Paenibacillus sp. DCT19 TaxID=2211212 RepID=UPI000FE1F9E6|nr:ribosomal protein L7/L12 [Paenibacillus sp. DCT19]